MIEIALGTLVVFLVVTGAMSLGALLTGKRLQGSCGGVGNACPCSDAKKARCARRIRDAA